VIFVGTNPVASEGFTPPGPGDFNLPPLGPDSTLQFLGESHYIGVTKPMLQLLLSAILIFWFFRVASARREMVPGKLQYVGEVGYGFVRNSLGRDIIGSHDFMRFVPYLFALFFFILINNFAATIPFVQFPTFSRAGLVYALAALFFFILLNNLFASIPFIQYPTFSRAGMAYAMAGISWVVYNAVGIRKHGLGGYLKLQTVPSGVSKLMWPLLIPLEFFSNIVVRPITLALRLFANMFAGHILLVLFSTGGLYLLQHEGVIGAIAGPLAWVLAILVGFLELLVQFLQAYVFALLNAMYISGALADEH
jgi:F-type H+-transporting ATPase subunit a